MRYQIISRAFSRAAIIRRCAKLARRCCARCRPLGNWRVARKPISKAWCCLAGSSKNSVSITSARSTGTTSMRSCARCVISASCRGRSFCTSSPARAKATRLLKAIRSNGTVPVRSIRRAARSSKKRRQALRSHKSSVTGSATWLSETLPSSVSRLLCAKALGLSNTRSASRIVTSMSR